jgi:transcriptional regulator with XRE-family HTH domain
LRQIPLLNFTIGRPAPGRAARVDDAEKHLGRNLARLRLAKGFTQERFAEVSGVTQQYVSDLERGLRNPTVVTLYNLAIALGVSHVELVMPDDEALRESAKPPRRKPGKT